MKCQISLARLLFAAAISGLVAPAAAQQPTFDDVAARCAPGVHPQTLAAVVSHESGFDPLAIGVKGSKVEVRSLEEAVASATRLIAEGKSVDLGLGQINANNLRWLGLSVREVFDPCINLAAAARILTENYSAARRIYADDQQALNAALSQYNTGNRESGLRNGYVAKVRRQAGLPPPLVPAVASATPRARTGMASADPFDPFGEQVRQRYDAFARPGLAATPAAGPNGPAGKVPSAPLGRGASQGEGGATGLGVGVASLATGAWGGP